MTAQEYIISTLEGLAELIATEATNDVSLEDAILAKVMSKKFRKFKVTDETTRQAKRAIQIAVQNNQPVKACVIFGGNKLWRLDEAPEIDWAELFCVIYYAKWLKSIASVYQPGAYLEFFSQEISVETLNNISLSESDQYTKTFMAMLEWVRPYLPDNITITYRRYGDMFSNPAKYMAELETAKTIVLRENNDELPVLSEAQSRATELNVRLRPGQADDPRWRERVELEHQAIFRTKTLDIYFGDESLISVNAGEPFPGIIILGSTKSSIAKFWAGVGALKTSGNSFNEVVLTPKQLANVDFAWEDVRLDGPTGKNFSKIRIVR